MNIFTGILDRIGLGRKKARPVGTRLELGRRAPEGGGGRAHMAVKVAILGLLIALSLAALPTRPAIEFAVQTGEIWRADDLVAPFDFPIFKSDEQMEAQQREVRYNMPPVFVDRPEAPAEMEANIDSLQRQLRTTFNEYVSWRRNVMAGAHEEARQDSARYAALREQAPLRVTPRQWNYLRDSYAARVAGMETPNPIPIQGRVLDEVLLDEVRTVSNRLLRDRVTNVPADSIRTDEIVVRDERERTERRVPTGEVYSLNGAQQFVQDYFRQVYPESPDTIAIGQALFRAVFEPSLIYQAHETHRRWEEAAERISPTVGMIQEGQVIIRQGEVVTDNVRAQLRSLSRVRAERSGNITVWKAQLGLSIPVLATFFMFFLYLFLLRRQIFDVNQHVLLICILFAAIVGLFALAVRLPTMPGYFVPVAVVSILLTIIYDSRVGIFGTLTLALLGGLFFGLDFEYTFATLFAGSLAVFSVRDIKNRGQFIVTAALVFAAYAAVVGAFSLSKIASVDRFMNDLGMVGINSVLLLLAYPLLWVFERAFSVTTDVTLLELSDTNRPLLKELSLRAPGSFNHTLQVANLTEAAANAIGANALLARVGALYHDIGKMQKPEYFVENQRVGSNPHDRLSPHMSALILASHVKDGIDMARQYRLPKVVIDFIPMHHGTSRIEYFYRKAQEQQKEGDPPVSETEFRYPGPKPNSKETGILILADGVEAASRSLNKPTRKRLEDLIDTIIQTRVDDGQLDGCPLTFADLRVIRNTFLSVLASVYHFRVKYPGQEKEEHDEEETVGALGTPVAAPPAPTEPPPEVNQEVEDTVRSNPARGESSQQSSGDGTRDGAAATEQPVDTREEEKSRRGE